MQRFNLSVPFHFRRGRQLALALGLGALMLTGMGMGSHSTPVQSAPSPLQLVKSAPPDTETQAAMIDAINDEYRARAYYTAVIEKFGPVAPFRNIVQAEDRHVQLWENLFNQYGVPVPEDTFAGNMTAPDTVLAACEGGIDAERADAQMYDDFLTTIDDPQLRSVFAQLQRVSLDNHLAAFERCVANGGQNYRQGGGQQQRRGR
mgnify:CR=1 FL=1